MSYDVNPTVKSDYDKTTGKVLANTAINRNAYTIPVGVGVNLPIDKGVPYYQAIHYSANIANQCALGGATQALTLDTSDNSNMTASIQWFLSQDPPQPIFVLSNDSNAVSDKIDSDRNHMINNTIDSIDYIWNTQHISTFEVIYSGVPDTYTKISTVNELFSFLFDAHPTCAYRWVWTDASGKLDFTDVIKLPQIANTTNTTLKAIVRGFIDAFIKDNAAATWSDNLKEYLACYICGGLNSCTCAKCWDGLNRYFDDSAK